VVGRRASRHRLERVGEPLDQVLRARITQGSKRGLLALLGQQPLEALASALQRTGYRGDRRLEDHSDLFRREPEDVPEDEHRARFGAQVLQGSDECELDPLALLVSSLGRPSPVRERELLVRKRLEPHRLTDGLRRLATAGLGGRAVVDRKDPPGASPQRVDADIRHDPVKPSAERTVASVVWESAPGPEQGFLHRILGVMGRAEHPVAVRLDPAALSLDQAPEGLLVPAAGSVEQRPMIGWVLC
jgi:hypothetical protein